MKKKAVCFLLAMVLVVALLPATVFGLTKEASYDYAELMAGHSVTYTIEFDESHVTNGYWVITDELYDALSFVDGSLVVTINGTSVPLANLNGLTAADFDLWLLHWFLYTESGLFATELEAYLELEWAALLQAASLYVDIETWVLAAGQEAWLRAYAEGWATLEAEYLVALRAYLLDYLTLNWGVHYNTLIVEFAADIVADAVSSSWLGYEFGVLIDWDGWLADNGNDPVAALLALYAYDSANANIINNNILGVTGFIALMNDYTAVYNLATGFIASAIQAELDAAWAAFWAALSTANADFALFLVDADTVDVWEAAMWQLLVTTDYVVYGLTFAQLDVLLAAIANIELPAWRFVDGVLTIWGGTLAAGDVVEITFEATINAGFVGDITNYVYLNGVLNAFATVTVVAIPPGIPPTIDNDVQHPQVVLPPIVMVAPGPAVRPVLDLIPRTGFTVSENVSVYIYYDDEQQVVVVVDVEDEYEYEVVSSFTLVTPPAGEDSAAVVAPQQDQPLVTVTVQDQANALVTVTEAPEAAPTARVNPQTSDSQTSTIAFVAFAALILSGAAYVLVSKKKEYN